MSEVDLALLGLQPGTLIWGQLGKNWWPGRVLLFFPQTCCMLESA